MNSLGILAIGILVTAAAAIAYRVGFSSAARVYQSDLATARSAAFRYQRDLAHAYELPAILRREIAELRKTE